MGIPLKRWHFEVNFCQKGPQTSPKSYFQDEFSTERTNLRFSGDQNSKITTVVSNTVPRKKPDLKLGKIQTEIYVQSTFSLAQTSPDNRKERSIYMKPFNTSTKKAFEESPTTKKPKVSQECQAPQAAVRPPASPAFVHKRRDRPSGHSQHDSRHRADSKEIDERRDGGREQHSYEWIIQNDSPGERNLADRPSTTRQNSFVSSPTQSFRRDFVAGNNPRLTDRSERLFSEELQAQLRASALDQKSVSRQSKVKLSGSKERLSHKENSDLCLSPLLSRKATSISSAQHQPFQITAKEEKTKTIQAKVVKKVGAKVQQRSSHQSKQPRIGLLTTNRQDPVKGLATSKK
jgi:hypothetical protein